MSSSSSKATPAIELDKALPSAKNRRTSAKRPHNFGTKGEDDEDEPKSEPETQIKTPSKPKSITTAKQLKFASADASLSPFGKHASTSGTPYSTPRKRKKVGEDQINIDIFDLRTEEGLAFEEIARRMNEKSGAQINDDGYLSKEAVDGRFRRNSTAVAKVKGIEDFSQKAYMHIHKNSPLKRDSSSAASTTASDTTKARTTEGQKKSIVSAFQQVHKDFWPSVHMVAKKEVEDAGEEFDLSVEEVKQTYDTI